MKLPQKIIDANVILRFFLADEVTLFQKAKTFIRQIEAGEEEVLLTEMVFAEVVWVLRKVYEISRKEISESFSKVIKLRGMKTVLDKEVFLQSLRLYPERNVDIQDLYLVSLAKAFQCTVITFDKTDFKKLEVSFSEP